MKANHLQLISPEAEALGEDLWFCGHCGQRHGFAPPGRICPCGLGMLLAASPTAAPGLHDPFMIVDGALCVAALSREAEKLLGMCEADAVNRHVGQIFVPADTEVPIGESFAARIASAVRGTASSGSVWLRPVNTFGVRFEARISTCGPPSAALIVISS